MNIPPFVLRVPRFVLPPRSVRLGLGLASGLVLNVQKARLVRDYNNSGRNKWYGDYCNPEMGIYAKWINRAFLIGVGIALPVIGPIGMYFINRDRRKAYSL